MAGMLPVGFAGEHPAGFSSVLELSPPWLLSEVSNRAWGQGHLRFGYQCAAAKELEQHLPLPGEQGQDLSLAVV